ncbi:Nudix hydrolase [Thalassoglobus neptunius]|uniref:Nudix hydrolase n=1 Tax=Thalassoglobus neptunius TaxID=1938619 RepID=A0A5C5X064_9PLAN|nr:NUDIX domain-containing protein [Thalassoglobus neptunius]TWT55582.1 Nudix hydrolase [Thalassoglobus neptunius]
MVEEVFDVCDSDDNVVGQAPRSVVHAKNLLHRAVHIWIWNSSRELLIQQRTASKDQYPHCLTSSASGHVDSGEDYLTAAQRELKEELQLSGQLEFLIKLPAGPETAYEHTVLYELVTDEPPVPDPDEIADLWFESPSELMNRLQQTPERLTPPFRQLFRWWAEHNGMSSLSE